MAITDEDKGMRAIRKELAKIDRRVVRVGILSKDANKHAGVNMAAIGTFNEFGTSRNPQARGQRGNPARSFMRSTFDENGFYEPLAAAVVRQVAGGQMTANKALKRIGLQAQSDVREKIRTLRDPPNSPATVARKGSSNPLIDTGRMRQSINFEIFRLT